MVLDQFAQQLKTLRTENQKTQQQVADYLGITRGAYSHFENGRNEPDRQTLIKLADYFGVTLDYLLGRNQTPKWAKPADIVELQDMLHSNIGMAFGGNPLTEEDKQKIESILLTVFWERLKEQKGE